MIFHKLEFEKDCISIRNASLIQRRSSRQRKSVTRWACQGVAAKELHFGWWQIILMGAGRRRKLLISILPASSCWLRDNGIDLIEELPSWNIWTSVHPLTQTIHLCGGYNIPDTGFKGNIHCFPSLPFKGWRDGPLLLSAGRSINNFFYLSYLLYFFWKLLITLLFYQKKSI